MMPCYQVQKVSVEFSAKHVDLLKQAITALGWASGWNGQKCFTGPDGSTFTIDLIAGTARIDPWQQVSLDRLKQAYTWQASKLAAKLNGWKVQPNATNANKFQLVRGAL